MQEYCQQIVGYKVQSVLLRSFMSRDSWNVQLLQGRSRTFVFMIWSRRGDKMSATREVENNISRMAMLPSLVS